MAFTRAPSILLALFLLFQGSQADTRYVPKLKTDDTTQVTSPTDQNDLSEDIKSRAIFRLNDESMIRDTLKASDERRNSFHETSTFDPDVLNKFLDEYANKIKSTTERSVYSYPYRITSQQPAVTSEIDNDHTLGVSTTSEDTVTIHGPDTALDSLEVFCFISCI